MNKIFQKHDEKAEQQVKKSGERLDKRLDELRQQMQQSRITKEAGAKGEWIGERGDHAAVDGRYRDTPPTNRGYWLLADVQALSSDSPEQGSHSVLSEVGSPGRRLMTGTNERGASSTSEFLVEETQGSTSQTSAAGGVSQMISS